MSNQCLSKETVDFTARGTCRSLPTVNVRMTAETTPDAALQVQRTTDGWLWYCLTGLLALQHLYCKEIQERSPPEVGKEEREIPMTANGQTTRRAPTDKEDGTVCVQGTSQDSVGFEKNSLLGATVRSLEAEMSKYKRLVEEIEGTNYKGIVSVCISVSFSETCITIVVLIVAIS